MMIGQKGERNAGLVQAFKVGKRSQGRSTCTIMIEIESMESAPCHEHL